MSSPLYIITTAYQAEKYIDRYLKSVTNELRFINNETHIFIGIDHCEETLYRVKKWKNENNNDKITFFYSEYNVGTYILKNSLLKKIPDEECFVHFFDIDDIFIPKFISSYYNTCKNLYLKYGPFFILNSLLLSVDESQLSRIYSSNNQVNLRKNTLFHLISKQKYEEAILLLLNNCYTNPDIINDDSAFDAQSIQNIVEEKCKNLNQLHNNEELTKIITKNIYHSDNTICTTISNILKIYSVETMDNQFIRKKQFFPGETCGVFFTTLQCMKKLGFFNKFRVNQDFDLMKRAEKMGIYSIRDYTLPFFIRSISETSLTQDKRTGYRSEYRKQIRCINQKLIDCNQLKAQEASCQLIVI